MLELKKYPLGLFLMLRTPDSDDWTNEYHTDIKDVISKIERHGESAGKFVILHVGFAFLPTEFLDRLAHRYRGCVMLTAAAHFTLLGKFTTSDEPIDIAGIQPVYLEMSHSKNSKLTSSIEFTPLPPTPEQMRANPPEHWTNPFGPLEPRDSYFKSDEKFGAFPFLEEVSLSENDFKISHQKTPKKRKQNIHSKFDPCELARTASPWLSSELLTSLEVPARARNVFYRFDIHIVADLADWTLDELLALPNLDVKSVRDTAIALRKAIEAGPPQNESATMPNHPGDS